MNSPDDNRSRRPHQSLEERARDSWRAAARKLDPAIAQHLRSGRRAALRETGASGPRAARWLLPSGAVATLALFAMMAWQPLPFSAPATSERPAVVGVSEADNELPPDAEQADPALYQNLDFYAWLAANDHATRTR